MDMICGLPAVEPVLRETRFLSSPLLGVFIPRLALTFAGEHSKYGRVFAQDKLNQIQNLATALYILLIDSATVSGQSSGLITL